MRPFSLNDLIIQKVFDESSENSEEQDVDDDDDEYQRSIFGSKAFLRGSHGGSKTVRMGKRRLPFETLNYGKRRLPFETLNYGKRRLPFETMNYGKRYENSGFEGYILGRELNE
jgi:hypothetical protein